MARHGCSLFVVLVALAAASAAPAPQPLPLHPASSELPLAELAAQRGFVLPPRKPLAEVAVDGTVTGAQGFPFGMADPQPPQRARGPRQREHGGTRAKRAADDVYDETRLPTSVVPTRYTVVMAPNLASGEFFGSTDIYLNVLEATSRIVLHGSPDIAFSQVQIFKYSAEQNRFDENGEARFVPLGRYDDADRLVVDLERQLVAGQHYLLRFPLFGSRLRSDLKGFYLSTYMDHDRHTHFLATTQFEPTAARYAFPCFDEPSLKARFKILIEHDRSLSAKSNMPEISRNNISLAIARTEFDETLPMSTYLLAWVVSDLENIAADAAGNFRTWGRSSLLSPRSAYLANTVGPKALQLLEELTGIPYALPKVDQFAIPDFEAGAMENWGLVTFKESYLLETEDTSIRIREFIATTVCHELGHQWTGNLVTLDWWSNTWLNEGFATYFENVICDKIFPEWNLMDKFVTDNVHAAIANDVLPGQVAMSSPVTTTGAIADKFDHISYKKGGSVLRMFEHILGTTTFKKAINRYLSENAFGSGSPDLLFRAMNAEAALSGPSLPPGADFATMARSWTEQAGVPVVTVTRNAERGTATITQEQFLYGTPDDEQAMLWYVPIPEVVTASTGDWTKTAPARWLTPDAPTIADLEIAASANEWIAVNPQQTGYYLVNYDPANWRLLQQALKAERSAAAWKAGIQALAFLRDRLAITEAAQALRAFVRQITADAFDAVGFEAERSPSVEDTAKDEERYLRRLVASQACYGGNEKCIRGAEAAVQTAQHDYSRAPADTRDAAFCYAVQNSARTSARILEMYMSAKVSTEKAQYAAALACTRGYGSLESLLDSILNGQGYPRPTATDLRVLINAILSQWDNHKFMLAYFQKRSYEIESFAGSGFFFSLLTALIKDARSEDELVEIDRFMAKTYPDPAMAAKVEQLLDATRKGLEWNRRHYAEVSQWLFAATDTGPVSPPTAPTLRPTEGPPTRPPPRTTTTITTTTVATTTAKAKGAAGRATGVATILLPSLLAVLLLRIMDLNA
ncbi:aminopeptidase M1-D-like [Thrips palmi]|uniref:Aminopeptidase M1-D-like n=1 Tax=Thrips palmi TaxID=161013 RepID=A0A6P8Z6C6_THRPL|nr:aminopeptidase M1-D-like [Thrips palmi]